MSQHRRTGFSLVELLVVIGIIGLLISLLLPALSAVRANGRRVACAAQQRELGASLALRAAAHNGYAQPAGVIEVFKTASAADLPQRLGDASRRRYTYEPISFFTDDEGLGNLLMSVDKDLRQSAAGEDAATDKLFICPEVGDEDPLQEMVLYRVSPDFSISFGRDTRTTYAENEGVFGIANNANDPRRLRGGLTRVREASRVVLLGDSQELGSTSAIFTWRPETDAESGPITLGDVAAHTVRVGSSAPVTGRHRGRANLLFADGHALGYEATAAGLADPLLTAQ